MKKIIPSVCIASLLLLSACAEQGIPGVKLQVEPTLPVPILIVPDHGTNNNQNNPYPNNQPPQQYTPPQTNYPNNNDNPPPRYEEYDDYRPY